jgi:putative heme iron utilization protein
MADAISPAISDRICAHMNEDHAEAVLLYAKTFGKTEGAIAAQLLAIDPEGMNLLVQTESATLPVRVGFDHVLQDSEDAHQTLIAMVKQARSKA